jgi:transcriptional regulator with XRE-family HTH domain
MKSLGDRIRHYRLTKKLSQVDMAVALNISRLAYSKIERNVTDPSYSRLLQIAKSLNVSIVDLVASSGKDTENEYQKLLLEKERIIVDLQGKLIKLMEEKKKKRK